MTSPMYLDNNNDKLDVESAELNALVVKPAPVLQPFCFLPSSFEKLAMKHHFQKPNVGKPNFYSLTSSPY